MNKLQFSVWIKIVKKHKVVSSPAIAAYSVFLRVHLTVSGTVWILSLCNGGSRLARFSWTLKNNDSKKGLTVQLLKVSIVGHYA